MLMLQLLDDNDEVIANDVNWDNNVVGQADNVRLLVRILMRALIL